MIEQFNHKDYSYIAHSSFAVVLPAHLLYLKYSTGNSPSSYLSLLWSIMQTHILAPYSTPGSKFPWTQYVRFTRIIERHNSSIQHSRLLGLHTKHRVPPSSARRPRWQPYKLLAVLLACIGVFITVYGNSTIPLRFKSILAYKKWAVPSTSIAPSYEDGEEDEAAPLSGDGGEPLPFGLFANFVTSTAGVVTFAVLWIPMTFSNWFGKGGYELPGDVWTGTCVGLIALRGWC
ncbi:hypothetical protein RHS01_00581 [Rhizoctonia solani]|uniref:Uncharacterized protein n=1 Tax=Rhizoctonia solani TaxID=456999 RepID=A0A8H7M925_9AGAM|nr:hypothetical protein RHS01_00581 [Rhizoctonia solani]